MLAAQAFSLDEGLAKLAIPSISPFATRTLNRRFFLPGYPLVATCGTFPIIEDTRHERRTAHWRPKRIMITPGARG